MFTLHEKECIVCIAWGRNVMFTLYGEGIIM